MAGISTAMIKDLRERTGLGMMECKKALAEADGDVEKAIEELRKSSGMKAAKKAGRTAADGVVAIRISPDAKFGVIVEINSETDFVARDENFLAFVEQVVERVFEGRQTDIGALLVGDLEEKRQALVQKIGENISVRRAALLEGDTVGGYVHSNGKIAVLTSLSGAAAEVAKDVAMHIAAINPQVVRPEDMAPAAIEKERAIYQAQAADSGKPADIVEKMIEGRVRKFLAENSLVEQAFVKNPDIKIGKLLSEAGTDISGFCRFEVGEGIEKDEVDFAAEVAAQVQQAN